MDKKTQDITKRNLNFENAVFLGKNKIAYLNLGNIELADIEN